ncbi:MAG TPA: ATP-dependent helicase, partial [Candidatus Limnocylindria bacterium]|nr:ATP-dependent helicase [Candidatus Limnocylindria bacterium]
DRRMSDVASASQPDPRRPATPAGDGAPVSLAAVNGLLRGLNREQRAAVTHADGPQLVVAGPGTGKTEVVTRRVAWLIATRRARPREILALTFTDNAADEMQARVDTLVPYGQADAHVHTFHAFGDRLLREFSFELGLPGDVRLLSRADLIVLLREQLFDLGLRRYLPLGDPGRFLGALVDLFGRAKDEDVTPDRLASHAAELLANSAAAEEPARSALADLAAARSELAIAYGRYCRLLGERGCIDHADQISLPLRLLRQRPAVRDAVQRRYRHVLVDELQDTNRAQLELVLAVAGDRANVTVVGDADQGIYAFRGAASGNLARFGAAYPAARQIVLRRNYRSRSPILKASGRLIRAIERGAHDRRPVLVAHRRARRPAAVRQLVFATPEEEADGIAERIARRIEQGVQPADFAVLVRSNGETDAILRSLRVRGATRRAAARRARQRRHRAVG